MKSILFIRHAKSSWEAAGMRDFDRPLNERGHRDAPMMAERLLEKKVAIELFVSSPAVRALTTAKYFHEAYGAKKSKLLEVPALYHASVETFYEVIAGLEDDYKQVAIFSHNPGITYAVNSFGVARVDDMPTCGVFGIHADTSHWKDFQQAEKSFWLFDYPKLF
jgi:phosphohistidine phosphatase